MPRNAIERATQERKHKRERATPKWNLEPGTADAAALLQNKQRKWHTKSTPTGGLSRQRHSLCRVDEKIFKVAFQFLIGGFQVKERLQRGSDK